MHRFATETLPTLTTGLTILKTDHTTRRPLHALTINQLVLSGGNAIWLDGANQIDPTTLHQLAPSPRVLERITVSRAFTAEQHFALIQQLPDLADRDTDLIVLPGIDHFYHEDDLLADEGQRMLQDVAAIIRREAERYDVPVLLTTTHDDSMVTGAATATVRCRRTSQGVAFEMDGFDTLTYSGPGYIQTTLKFWEHLLQATYERIDTTDSEKAVEVPAVGT